MTQLKSNENPVKFYVWEMCFQWSRVNVNLTLDKNGRECCKKLYGNLKNIDLKEAEFYWRDGDILDLTLEDWYNQWLYDPWR